MQHVAEIAQMSRGCQMLILKELKEKGFVITTPDGWDMHPGLKELRGFTANELTALRMLGLERKSKLISLSEILSRDEKPANGAADEGSDETK
jgi:hypothetical protein